MTIHDPNLITTDDDNYLTLPWNGTTNPQWTINHSAITPWITSTPTNDTSLWSFDTVQQSAKIELRGDDADIIVNGHSLMDSIHNIERRLNLLRPNPGLEAKWDQLRELGEQYRRLEAELEEKQRMWEALQKENKPSTP